MNRTIQRIFQRILLRLFKDNLCQTNTICFLLKQIETELYTSCKIRIDNIFSGTRK